MKPTNIGHPAPTSAQLEEAARLRLLAKGRRDKANESFDRCDTDGFLSQWADNLTAQEYLANAEILEHGGQARFVGLYKDSVRVRARLIAGDYGSSWMLLDEGGLRIGVYFPQGRLGEDMEPVNSPRTKLVKAGYLEKLEWAPAVAKCVGTGTGLSGRCWIAVVRTDKGY